MTTPTEFPDLRIPEDLRPEQMPDLLRYWYLGPRARRHMMLRRFSEVDSRAIDHAARLELRGRPRLLDIGSAWGFNVMALDRMGVRATGMDLVVDQFEVGASIARANGACFDVVGADAASLPFGDESFDMVTMVETLEHVYLEDRPAALGECRRVLRPGGVVVLSTPNFGSLVERFKRFASRHDWMRAKLPTMCYPEEGTARGEYHPYRYHHPLPDRDIRRLLEDAGFVVGSVSHFLFMLKNTSNAMYPLMSALERLGERLPGVRRLAATTCVTAVRR